MAPESKSVFKHGSDKIFNLALPGTSIVMRTNARVRSTFPRVGSSQRLRSNKRSYMPSYQPLADMARVSKLFVKKLTLYDPLTP